MNNRPARARIPQSLRDAAWDTARVLAIATAVTFAMWLAAAHAQTIPASGQPCPGKPIPVIAERAELWAHWYENWEFMPPGWTRPNGQHAILVAPRAVIPETGAPAIWVDAQGVVRCFRRPPPLKAK